MEAELKVAPAVRGDGRCVVCRGERKMPRPLQKGVPLSMYELDPFCSAVCARKFFGNPISGTSTSS